MDKHLVSFHDLIGKAQSKGIVADLFVADKSQVVLYQHVKFMVVKTTIYNILQ